ncbi:ABC transporter substrate-binding protein, partial [Kingella kingae]|nr:ABC transporter substrate-binding protein [Kingella kingae]
MNTKQIVAALSASVLSINLAWATPQQAVEQVRGNATQVLNILKQANGSNDAAVRKQAEDYAMPYFDFALMTRLAVSSHWSKASEAQKQTLVAEFRKMLIRVYAGQMLRYKNAQVDVKSNAISKDGGSLLRGKQTVSYTHL